MNRWKPGTETNLDLQWNDEKQNLYFEGSKSLQFVIPILYKSSSNQASPNAKYFKTLSMNDDLSHHIPSHGLNNILYTVVIHKETPNGSGWIWTIGSRVPGARSNEEINYVSCMGRLRWDDQPGMVMVTFIGYNQHCRVFQASLNVLPRWATSQTATFIVSPALQIFFSLNQVNMLI